MTDTVLVAIITGVSTLIAGLLAIVLKRLDTVHKLVNSAATDAQKKIDTAADEIVHLKEEIAALKMAYQAPRKEVR